MKYKLEHACIRVMDLEKSLEFYRGALGLEEVRRKDFPEWKFTLVYLSDEDRNFEIELTYNYDPEKPYELGNGFSHFALTVVDLEGSHSAHKEAGYTVTDLKGLPGEKPMYYFVTDPDGYMIEIIRGGSL
ncbi:lactoylglutathione lyase [Propionigenium maris DSM 9537]|uniref:Aldoketomutase n=1 Tax=Propionigenium maris DSM 9537 TaxID=1123000 RepID=A0A9W6LM49_9FUSO|nr:VOC family protein [Propionigenium maris]GLI55307.1 lactoylglutathione lyase [Propionigenium maris DSM 9537]